MKKIAIILLTAFMFFSGIGSPFIISKACSMLLMGSTYIEQFTNAFMCVET
jgi:hypothetical protein